MDKFRCTYVDNMTMKDFIALLTNFLMNCNLNLRRCSYACTAPAATGRACLPAEERRPCQAGLSGERGERGAARRRREDRDLARGHGGRAHKRREARDLADIHGGGGEGRSRRIPAFSVAGAASSPTSSRSKCKVKQSR